MTNKVWTTEEMNEISALRKAGNSWQYIADKMYYTYEDGYLVSLQELDAQFNLWLKQEKAFEKANKLFDMKSEMRMNDRPKRKMGRLSILEKTEIIQYTEIHKMSIEDIAKKMNRTTEAIKNYLKKYRASKRQMAELEKAKDVPEIAKVINPVMNTENILLDPDYTEPITKKEYYTDSNGNPYSKTKVIHKLSSENKKLKGENEELTSTFLNKIFAAGNSDDSTISSADLIKNQCDIISQMLVAKNEQYGDSVFKPMRIFSKVDATQQLRVRIDDKISRLIRGNDSIESDEDIIDDLIGYLILLKIQMRNTHSHD
jgi:DNA-directed RNA polymerase specialized sigma24 family protein